MKIPFLVSAIVLLVASTQEAPAQIVFSTGKQTIEAVTPEGQFIGFRYEVESKVLVCGIRVSRLVFEQKLDGTGPEAKLFLFVHDLELATNKLEYAYSEDGSDKTMSGQTEFKDVDFSSGHILLTAAKLPFSQPDSRYKLTLTGYFKGTMVLIKEKMPAPLTGVILAEEIDFADGGKRVLVAKGTGTIKTEEGVAVASGDLVITKDGSLALKGKPGVSFRHTPASQTLPIKWPTNGRDIVSVVQFDGKDTWTLKDRNFLFFLECGSNFQARVLVNQSLFHSSCLILPEGKFSLMGYSVSCGSGGGSVVFKAGKPVHGQNAVVETPDKKRLQFPHKADDK